MTAWKKINWRAIALGLGAYLVAGIGFIALFTIGVFIYAFKAGFNESQAKAFAESPIVQGIALILGFGTAILFGFVAARRAGQGQVRHGALAGAIISLLYLPSWQYAPLWSNIIGLIGTLPCAIVGGLLALRYPLPQATPEDSEQGMPTAPHTATPMLGSPLRLLREGARTAMLGRAQWQGLTTTPWTIGLLVLLELGLAIGLQRLYIVGEASFYWQAIAGGWLGTAILAWVSYLARPTPAIRSGGITVRATDLFGLLIAQSIVITAVFGAVFVVLMRKGWYTAEAIGTIGIWALWLAPASWAFVAHLTGLARDGLPEWGRMTTAATLLVVSAGIAYYVEQNDFWIAAPRQSGAPEPERLRLSQESMEAQQALFAEKTQALLPHRTAATDLYAITYAPYSMEEVFRRESNMVATVMESRFDAKGRTLQLINNAGTTQAHPWATPLNLERTIRHMATLMDREEDILFLHLTSHGARNGSLSASFWPLEMENVTPANLKKWLDEAGIRNRVISVSACFSGSWIAPLVDDDTLIMTAADAEHTSYGCGRKSELTFFGRAVFDEQLRTSTRSFEMALGQAREVIRQRETEAGKDDGYSNPQISVGKAIRDKLNQLEKQLQAEAH